MIRNRHASCGCACGSYEFLGFTESKGVSWSIDGEVEQSPQGRYLVEGIELADGLNELLHILFRRLWAAVGNLLHHVLDMS